MNLADKKREITKEIKATKEYLEDLKEMSISQGTKHFYPSPFNKKEMLPRWMYLGDYFFPSTITRTERAIKALEKLRSELDIKIERDEITKRRTEESD